MSTAVVVFAGDEARGEGISSRRLDTGTLVLSITDDPPIHSIETIENLPLVIVGGDSNAMPGSQGSCNWLRHCLAGLPQCVSSHARLTYDRKYQAYYAGGGTPKNRGLFCSGGDKRCPDEGTFGVDYAPWYSRVNLRWSHGFLYQGGNGLYEPDRKNWPFDLRRGRHVGESAE